MVAKCVRVLTSPVPRHQVTISAKVADKFSKEARASLDEDDGSFKIGGLSFMLHAKGHDFATIKPPSPDDRLKNAIFNSAAKKAWTALAKEARESLDSEFGANRTDAKRLAAGSQRGLMYLYDLIEIDREVALKKERDDDISRRETGRTGHLKWLANKDKTKILLPPSPRDAPVPEQYPNIFKTGGNKMVSNAPPSGKSFRKIPASKPPPLPTSVDIVRGMDAGLRYAHATGEGASRDLLASRAQLLKEGHVMLQNFSSTEDGTIGDEAREAYERELSNNSFMRAQTVGVMELKARDAAVYTAWCISKDARALALECMDLLPCTLSFETDTDGMKQPLGAPLKGNTDTAAPHDVPRAAGAPAPGEPAEKSADEAPLLSRPPSEDERALWRAVGYACRAIDRTLLPTWIMWSEALWSKASCWLEWINFGPPDDIVIKTAHRDKRVVAGGSMESANIDWGPVPRTGALKLLRTLTDEHRRLMQFRATAAAELPPSIPTFRRVPAAEALPTFIHGAEGALQRAASDLAVKDGMGLSFLGGRGVGAELVLQWWVGEEEAGPPPPSSLIPGAAPEPVEKLVKRLGAAKKKAEAKLLDQPPYVIVLESVGISGGVRAREGDWQRTFVDPPEPLPLLTSAPGSTFVPIGVHAQGLRILPPRAGEEWAARKSTALRGALRVTGLLPNTTYAFRIRAFSRAGAGPYAFAAFCTAPSPPPAPTPGLKNVALRQLFSGEGVADLIHATFPFQPDAVSILWERRIDFRGGLLRLLRTFWMAATLSGALIPNNSSAGLATARTHIEPVEDEDGIKNYGDDVDDNFSVRGPGGIGLFSAAVVPKALLTVIAGEIGLRNWLASCVAVADVWPTAAGVMLRDAVQKSESDAGMPSVDNKRPPAKTLIATAKPISVLEALVTIVSSDAMSGITWAEICALFSHDAEMEAPETLLLADVYVPPIPPRDDTLPTVARTDLTSTSSKGDVLLAITARSSSTSRPTTARPSTAGSALSAARSTSASRAAFNPIGGVFSDVSVRNAALRASSTVLSRAVLKGTHTGGVAGTVMEVRPRGVPAPSTVRPSSANSASARPQSAWSHGALSDAGLGTSVLSRAPTIPSIAPPAGAAALKTTYSLYQCQSDGPLGQEWAEVYVGVRAARVLDKLLPGTCYTLKAQAINVDGQASLFGPQMYVTTALPAPTRLRAAAPPSATSVYLEWMPVSSVNSLGTARMLGKAAASPSGEDDEETAASPKALEAGVDIDTILDALLKKTKGTDAVPVVLKKGEAPKKVSVPVREGDGGYGVDLVRPWNRYDVKGTGRLPVKALRGLLADLGAYSETASLIGGASDPNVDTVSSCEGAACVGAMEWRLNAAIAKLDPASTGYINYADFADWWNAVDAAIEKARVAAVTPAASRNASRINSARSTAYHTHRPSSASAPSVVGPNLGIDGDNAELGASVVYIVEARRSVPEQEVSDAVAAVLLGGTTSRTSSAMARPSSARSVLTSNLGATIPSGMTAQAAASEAASLLGAGSMTPWAVVYMGSQTNYKLKDLLPNGHYLVRVTAIGRHSISSPCKPLQVHMPPLAPLAPIVISVGSRSVSLRWYPGELFADKYEVQVKIVEALLSTDTDPQMAATLGRRLNDGSVFEGRCVNDSDHRALLCARATRVNTNGVVDVPNSRAQWDEDATFGAHGANAHTWATVFTGVSTTAAITGLFSNTVYRVRVVAFSSAGVASNPSHEIQFVSLDNGSDLKLSVAGVVKDFTVECRPADASELTVVNSATISPRESLLASQQDIVVGDTILFTEDVFMDGTPEHDVYHSIAPKEVPEEREHSKFLCSRTVAAVVIGETASRLAAGTGSSAALGNPGGPVYVGLQANAIKALKRPADANAEDACINSHTTIASARKHTSPPGNIEDALRTRSLLLQVEWSVLSLPPLKERPNGMKALPPRPGSTPFTRAAANSDVYALPMGSIVNRRASDLSKLDIFRMQWFEETKGGDGRWSLAEEMAASYDR